MALTRSLATKAAELRAEAGGPADTVAAGFVDCIAVMHAGWDAPVPRHLRHAAGLGTWQRPLAIPGAATGEIAQHLAVAAHALDFDDTAFAGHTSAVLVPAILAEASRRPVTGADAVAAYLAGYELWGELVAREPDSIHGKGWHPSAVYGAPAAAAAVARLRSFGSEETATAISLAASMAGGLGVQFGTWAKPWQLGRAARSGHEAADLSASGMRAAADAFEHPLGLLAALSPAGRSLRDGHAASALRIRETGLNIKRYPVCYAMHRALDAVADLRATHGFAPEAVAHIRAEIGAAQAAILRHMRPDTVTEAAFSLPFGIAAMLTRGACGPSELTDEVVHDAALRSLLPKVAIEPLDGRLPDEPSLSPWDRVTIQLANGTELVSEKIAYPLGHFRNPLPSEALREKFDACVVGVLRREEAKRLHVALSDLAGTEDLSSLIRRGASI